MAMIAKSLLLTRKNFMGVELNGKTLGVVGCGRIGQVCKCGERLQDDMPDVMRRTKGVMNAAFYAASAIHLILF